MKLFFINLIFSFENKLKTVNTTNRTENWNVNSTGNSNNLIDCNKFKFGHRLYKFKNCFKKNSDFVVFYNKVAKDNRDGKTFYETTC